MIIGILWGIYLKNISPFLCSLIILYNFPLKNKKIRIIKKIYLKKEYFILFLIVCLISSIYVKNLENKYKSFEASVEQNINAKAIIVSDKKEGNYTYRYKVEIISNKFKNINLYIYIKKDFQELKYGDIIMFSGEYQELSTPKNYRGFNYKEYAKKEKIYGSCIVEKIECIGKKKSILSMFSNINREISNKIKMLFDEKEAELLNGIILGNTTNIDENVINYFRDSSLAHILAVSGTHVSYIIIALNIFLRKTNLGKKSLKLITIITLVMFLLIVGFTASVMRAIIMGVLIISSGIFYRKSDTLNNMNISIILILIYNPYFIRDIGFLLSYGGVIGIIGFYNIFRTKFQDRFEKNKITKYIKESLIISFSVQIVILPINIMLFNNVSIIFFISNILVLPLIGGVIITSIFIIITSFINLQIIYPLARIVNIVLKLIIFITKFLANLPFSNFLVITPDFIYVIFYYLVLIYVLFRKQISRIINKKVLKKIFIITVIITIITNCIINIINKKFTIYFVDVGQR